MNKLIIAGIMSFVVGVGAGGYAGWNFKPSSGEGLALSALQQLADRRAEEDRRAYEVLQAQLEGQQQAADERAATAARDRIRATQRHDAEVSRLADETKFAIERAQVLEQEAESAKVDLSDTRAELSTLLEASEDTALVEAVAASSTAADEVIAALTEENQGLYVVIEDQSQIINLKDALIAALNEDSFAKDNQYSVLLDRFQAAEDRIEQLNGRRLNFGVSVGGGLVNPLKGSWGLGTATIVSLNLRLW